MTKGIITLCESARQRLIEELGLAPEIVRAIGGAVDIKRFNPTVKGDEVRREFGLDEDVPLAGVVARFHDHGKHDYFLKAILEIKKIVPRAKFFLIGRGKYGSVLKDMAKELGITQDVIFVGQRGRDYPQVLASLNVKVYLIPGTDGSCRAVLEAMAVGKPIVAAPVGPILEIVKEGVSRFMVRPEDTSSLAKAIAKLLADGELARRMGRKGRKLIEKGFREEMRAEKTEQLYYDLTGGNFSDRNILTNL